MFKEIPWLEREEFDSLDDFLRNFKLNAPEIFNFGFDVVDRIAAADPNRRALQWCNDAGEEHLFTMSDVAKMSNRAANAFWQLGIRRGDRVMLVLKRRYEYWFALVALAKIGAIAIPATNMLKPHDIVYRVQRGKIKMLLCVNDAELIESVREAEKEISIPVKAIAGCAKPDGWLDFDELMNNADDTLSEEKCARDTGANDTMLVYFTSGTSGMPKMVIHDFLYPLGHIVTAKYWQHVEHGGLHLTVAETGWAKASWGKIYGQWICGSAIMVYDMDRFHADSLLKVVQKYKVTTFCAPPTVYRFFIKEDLSKYDWSCVHHCTTAGEALHPEVFEQFHRAMGLRIYEGFGQTESTAITANFYWGTPKPGSMGIPAPSYKVCILNDEGKPCESGEEGQVCISLENGKPCGLFNGYYGDEELTAAQWHDGFYHTGDVAWKDEDGFLWFVGRADDVIKSSGYRIGPFEVESALMQHPAVTECAITAAPDPVRGQVVKATIMLTRGFQPSDDLVKELQEHVKKVTAPYKYPRIIEFVDELPKTISGKIRHKAIRQKDAEKASS